MLSFALIISSCANNAKKSTVTKANYPSEVIPFMDEWKILCGDGTSINDLANKEHKDFFYVANDGKKD